MTIRQKRHNEERVVVDECVGRDSELVAAFNRRRAGHPATFLYLAESHPGMPDVEILDKLMGRDTVLLTTDVVLHNRAIGEGFRSFTPAPPDGLTDRPLAGVKLPRSRPPSALPELQPSYRMQAPPGVAAIMRALNGLAGQRQHKAFRSKRRRIRSHFGSDANLARVDLTVGQRAVGTGQLGGYLLKVDGNHGVKSLQPASEGYVLDRAASAGPNGAVLHALTHLYHLHLSHLPLALYVISQTSRTSCLSLLEGSAPSDPVDRAIRQLLAPLPAVAVHACAKGRFHDRMKKKLDGLARAPGNEIVAVDLAAVGEAITADAGADAA